MRTMRASFTWSLLLPAVAGCAGPQPQQASTPASPVPNGGSGPSGLDFRQRGKGSEMTVCKFCGRAVLGPCDNVRLAERCQSLRSTCDFCGQDVYWPCDDAEKAERCGKRLG